MCIRDRVRRARGREPRGRRPLRSRLGGRASPRRAGGGSVPRRESRRGRVRSPAPPRAGFRPFGQGRRRNRRPRSLPKRGRGRARPGRGGPPSGRGALGWGPSRGGPRRRAPPPRCCRGRAGRRLPGRRRARRQDAVAPGVGLRPRRAGGLPPGRRARGARREMCIRDRSSCPKTRMARSPSSRTSDITFPIRGIRLRTV